MFSTDKYISLLRFALLTLALAASTVACTDSSQPADDGDSAAVESAAPDEGDDAALEDEDSSEAAAGDSSGSESGDDAADEASTESTDVDRCPEPGVGQNLLVSEDGDYCLLYPTAYQVEQPSEGLTVLTVGGLLDVENPRLHIEVRESDGQTADEVADALLADYEGIDVSRATVHAAGHDGVILDRLPGQDLNRRVIFVADGRVYDLMYSPADRERPELYSAMEELYTMTLQSLRIDSAID